MWTSSFLFFFFLLITWPAQVLGNFFAISIYSSRKVGYGCLPTEKGDGRGREAGKDCGEKGSMEGGKFLCGHGQWRPDTEVTGAGGGRAEFGRWGILYPCPPPSTNPSLYSCILPLHKPLTYSWDLGYLKEFFHLELENVFSSLDLWQSASVNLACKPLKLYDSNSCSFYLGTLG